MRLFLITFFLFISLTSWAIEPGQTLPNIQFNDLGQLQLDQQGDVIYQPFSSKQLQGKRWLVQYIAPRLHVGSLNRALNDKMNQANQGRSCQTASIINLDNALWGTKHIALAQMKKEFKLNTHCILVADNQSLGIKRWSIPKKSNVNWVIDEQGTIIFYHEGKLSAAQMQHIIDLLQP